MRARRQRHAPGAGDRAAAGGHHPHQREPGQDAAAGEGGGWGRLVCARACALSGGGCEVLWGSWAPSSASARAWPGCSCILGSTLGLVAPLAGIPFLSEFWFLGGRFCDLVLGGWGATCDRPTTHTDAHTHTLARTWAETQGGPPLGLQAFLNTHARTLARARTLSLSLTHTHTHTPDDRHAGARGDGHRAVQEVHHGRR